MIADISAQVLRQRSIRSGTWHLTATGQTSWFGFAEAIIDGAQARGLLARRPRILPIATVDYPTPAARPAYSVLDTTKLQHDFGLVPGAWQEELGNTLDVMMAQVSPR
jgi:dTDP-4-dehydrorhamnose reductase